jgi:hypothetical protein
LISKDFLNYLQQNKLNFGVNMKRKPDAMIALIALFFIGLVVSGFSSMTIGSSRPVIEGASLYFDGSETDRTASR